MNDSCTIEASVGSGRRSRLDRFSPSRQRGKNKKRNQIPLSFEWSDR